ASSPLTPLFWTNPTATVHEFVTRAHKLSLQRVTAVAVDSDPRQDYPASIMALYLGAVGAETKTHQLEYDWKTLALYALGIGAKREELDYLYEHRGPKVYPSFAVVPAYAVLTELL